MTENEWVDSILIDIQDFVRKIDPNYGVESGKRLPYSSEIITYLDDKPKRQNRIKYQTDILISERINDEQWKPRIVIEAKKNRISTHDAITYSQKAQTHKNVHPFLRYGILIGNRKNHPLPGRLFRHGQHFDFMQSWQGFKAENNEWEQFTSLIEHELSASKILEEILFNSRSKQRDKYTCLHKPLNLE